MKNFLNVDKILDKDTQFFIEQFGKEVAYELLEYKFSENDKKKDSIMTNSKNNIHNTNRD